MRENIKIEKEIISIGNLLSFNRIRNKLNDPNKKCEKVKEAKIKEYFSTFIFTRLGNKKIIDENKIKIYENILLILKLIIL